MAHTGLLQPLQLLSLLLQRARDHPLELLETPRHGRLLRRLEPHLVHGQLQLVMPVLEVPDALLVRVRRDTEGPLQVPEAPRDRREHGDCGPQLLHSSSMPINRSRGVRERSLERDDALNHRIVRLHHSVDCRPQALLILHLQVVQCPVQLAVLFPEVCEHAPVRLQSLQPNRQRHELVHRRFDHLHVPQHPHLSECEAADFLLEALVDGLRERQLEAIDAARGGRLESQELAHVPVVPGRKVGPRTLHGVGAFGRDILALRGLVHRESQTLLRLTLHVVQSRLKRLVLTSQLSDCALVLIGGGYPISLQVVKPAGQDIKLVDVPLDTLHDSQVPILRLTETDHFFRMFVDRLAESLFELVHADCDKSVVVE
mmetsp:Transcript_9769/g.30324  ORF Transcript_9769/g.30324 Transcript_9769/m.30324 type:complete len:372 (-) Transcript_9769:531-1646(-)